MDTLIDHVLPRAHLDAVFGVSTEAVERLGVPTNRAEVVESLRRSLGLFVRGEVTSALNVAADVHLVPASLQRHFVDQADRNPPLEAFAGRRASQWKSAVIELLHRLEHDWPALVKHFGFAQNAALVGISPPLGDPHHDGRGVYRLTFDSGMSLIYKPRSVETEQAFGELVSWLQLNDCEPDLRACKVLPRKGYGWTQFVPTTYCETSGEMAAYYRRQGGFLALFWILCAGDAIGDNLVISGEHPIWIDSECLSRPQIPAILNSQKSFPLWIRDSMLVTAMVLYGGDHGASRHFRTHTGLHVSCARDRDRAFTADDVLRPPYIRAVVSGFESVYRWFLSHDGARALDNWPLAVCRDRQVRVLLRSTQTYTVLLTLLAMTPEPAKDEVTNDVWDVLRLGDPLRVGPFPEDIVRAEIYALQRGDVPYWSVSTSSRDLWEAHGNHARDAASASCLECIAQRTARMSESDLARQAWLLESFLGGGRREAFVQ